jgi:hypothetical protein
MPWSIKRKTNAWDLSTAPERHKGLGMNLKAARLSSQCNAARCEGDYLGFFIGLRAKHMHDRGI